MVHVDVNIQRDKLFTPDSGFLIVAVEVSTDGGPWKRLADFKVNPHTNDTNETQQRIRAREFAAAWIDGARYAGADVRATSFGQEGL